MRERGQSQNGQFRATAIAGTHTVLLALDCDEERRKGLLGFAIQRQVDGQTKWLPSLKVFKSVVPNPPVGTIYDTIQYPIQSFLWGDYTAEPDTDYKFQVYPMYGSPGALQKTDADMAPVDVRTEKEFDRRHGVWFNRGAIASQAFARKFGNQPPPQPDNPKDEETAWLSRGLLEACLAFIDGAKQGEGLRVAAYEFTYKPILDALKNALGRGVDVKIVYHDTTTAKGSDKNANETAMRAAGLPVNDQKVTFRRSKTQIPHNKFIVLLSGGNPVKVWTGSTNFTDSGFLGQSNVGHLVEDGAVAKRYLDFWTVLKGDPERAAARAGAIGLSPNPPCLIPGKSIATVFSPRQTANMLTWYGDRMLDATSAVMFTAAFGVSKQLVGPLAKERPFLRFVLMEKPPAGEAKADLTKDRDLIISYGAVLSDMYTMDDGTVRAKGKIAEFDLEKWYFRKEALYRKTGNIFYIHTKFLLVDPLSDDPLVCSGSANFSANSLQNNDENMLLIRGDTRVADIYMTEFDRIFRHFYFRDIANQQARAGKNADDAFLTENDSWTNSYFKPGAFKTVRREMFFKQPAANWTAQASKDKPLPDEVAKPGRQKAGGKTSTAKKKTTKTASKKKKTKAKKKKTVKKKATRKKSAAKKKVKRKTRKTRR